MKFASLFVAVLAVLHLNELVSAGALFGRYSDGTCSTRLYTTILSVDDCVEDLGSFYRYGCSATGVRRTAYVDSSCTIEATNAGGTSDWLTTDVCSASLSMKLLSCSTGKAECSTCWPNEACYVDYNGRTCSGKPKQVNCFPKGCVTLGSSGALSTCSSGASQLSQADCTGTVTRSLPRASCVEQGRISTMYEGCSSVPEQGNPAQGEVPSSRDDDEGKTSIFIGITVAAVAVAVLVTGVVTFLCTRQRQRHSISGVDVNDGVLHAPAKPVIGVVVKNS